MYAINLHDIRLRCLARDLPEAFGDRGGIVDDAVGHEPRPLGAQTAAAMMDGSQWVSASVLSREGA